MLGCKNNEPTFNMGTDTVSHEQITDTGKQQANLKDSGEILFNANCTSCHAIAKELTAPPPCLGRQTNA